eukprot:TRINITY_DN2505_c0_g5_i1.p1 TRINITY_DN2505_c0_g5~~TRINITY_DN2505_c0_g5_i1.p1  ORF type:complete len:398 (+),score=33.41 TRINITY_DN2505_c0_g5_i1:125-1318(+)
MKVRLPDLHRGTILTSILLQLMVSVQGTAPAPPVDPPTAGNSTPADDNSGGEATGVIAAIIITFLTLVGLFLYYWYSRRERKKEAGKKEWEERQKEAFLEEIKTTPDNKEEKIPAPIPPVPLPPPGMSPPFTGGSEAERENLVSTFSSQPEQYQTEGVEYRIGDKVIARKGDMNANFEGGRVVASRIEEGCLAIQYDDGAYDSSVPNLWIFPMGKFSKGDRVHTRHSRSGTITSYVGPSLYEVKLDGGGYETASESELAASASTDLSLPMKRSHTTALPALEDENDPLSGSLRRGGKHRSYHRARMHLPPPSNTRRSRREYKGDPLNRSFAQTESFRDSDPLSKSVGHLSANTDALEALAGLHSIVCSPLTPRSPRTPGFRGSMGASRSDIFTSMQV